MSFGRNPHVAKAEAAEQKARDARDDLAHAQAWREAARQWERAASREKSDKLKREYTEKAEAARANADGEGVLHDADDAHDLADAAGALSTADEDTVPVINTRSPKVLH